MAERIAFEVNEETRTVEVAPDTPLLYVLRNELGLSNPHFGCGLAQCGACTVHVDGAPTRSCSLPVSAAAGTKVTTLAGLGTSEHPHPLQVAFIAEQVPQCGYCPRRSDVAASGASLPTAPLAQAAHPRKTAASRRRKANSRERQVRT